MSHCFFFFKCISRIISLYSPILKHGLCLIKRNAKKYSILDLPGSIQLFLTLFKILWLQGILISCRISCTVFLYSLPFLCSPPSLLSPPNFFPFSLPLPSFLELPFCARNLTRYREVEIKDVYPVHKHLIIYCCGFQKFFSTQCTWKSQKVHQSCSLLSFFS